MMRCVKSFSKGFTLIELLVVMALLGILLAIVAPLYLGRVHEAREVVLKQNLYETRKTIDQFYRDKQRYPNSLNELVEAKYLRDLPMDPITQSTRTWVEVKDTQLSGVSDLRSGATDIAKDGVPYAKW